MSGKSYIGVAQRSFKSAVVQLLETDYGLVGSRRVLEMLADDVTQLAAQFHPPQGSVQSGWLVFTGTQVTGAKAQPGKSAGDYPLVTLAWPVLLPEDVQVMIDLPPGHAGRQRQAQLLKTRLQRLIEYGVQHPEGPVVLTTADLGLMLGRTSSSISHLLTELRQETSKPLLTKGYYFDQGVRPSHKAEIIALYEQGMDEADIARQAQHAPGSVGRYLRDYERVKLLLKKGFPASEVAPLLGMQPTVVRAYVALLQQYHPKLLSETDVSASI